MELENHITVKPVETVETNTIKHIVIAGGGPTGFSYYGILKETNVNKVWKFENIKSIYGTSVGAMISVMLCLNYEWEILDDYLIKRPWQNVYKFNMFSLIDSYQKKGILDIKVIDEMFSPLFKGKDISLDITMKEFYELTKIELHIFSTEMISYKQTDFSYLTHPDLKVTEAVYCSACLPIIFSPFVNDGKCYGDGAFISNYSLEECINNGNNPNEILGIRKEDKNTKLSEFTESSSLLDYMMLIINNISRQMFSNKKTIVIPNEYVVKSEQTSIYSIYSFANSQEERMNYINKGIELVRGEGSIKNPTLLLEISE